MTYQTHWRTRRLAGCLLISSAGLLALPATAQVPWCAVPVPPCDPDSPSSACYRPKPPDERCEPKECDKCTKSPCYVATGVYEGSVVDLELPTSGFQLAASRKYQSSHMIDGPAGYGWTSSLDVRLYYALYLFAAPSTYQRRAVVIMPDGARYLFADNGSGSFTPPLGRYDTLVRNGDGTFDLTLQRSRSVLHFGTDGALLSLEDEHGNAQVMTYDANGRIERVADAAGSGRFVDVFWGADGRIALLQDSAGRTVEYAYDARGVMISATDPLDRTTSYSYVQGKYVPLLAGVRDHWNRVVTEIAYDSVDRVSSYSEQLETWTYTYNYQNDPTKTAKTDQFGNTWVFTHGAGGLVTATTPPAATGGAASYASYFADGSIQQETDETGVKTAYAYDSQGRVTSLTRDFQGSKAVRYDYTYDPAFPDRITSVTPRKPSTGAIDLAWQAWRYDYHQAGSPSPGALFHVYRVRTDSGLDAVASYTYDARGRILSVASAAGATTEYAYDGAGNLTSVTAPANNDTGTRPVTEYGHDALGRVTTLIDPMGAITAYSYDPLNRLLSVTLPKPAADSPLDFTTRYQYDGFDPVTGLLFTTITDPNGNVARPGHDQFDRLIQTIDHLGARTRYAYDGALLVTIADANDNVTTYAYDPLRRLSSTTFSDGRYESYAYFADGLLQRKTDRKGQTITYDYDPFKRLVATTYPDTSGIRWTYTGELLTRVEDTSVSPLENHTFSYDSSYRLVANTQGDRGTIDYTYNVIDQLASYTVGGGPTAAYTYYPDGTLNTIEWSPVLGEFKYSYTPRGQYQRIAFPNGQSREYVYDGQGRLLKLANMLDTDNIATFTYAYDRNHTTGTDTMLGQRTSMTAETSPLGLGGAETKYRYDPNYQLTRVDYPNVPPFNNEIHQWTYDAIGNRLTSTLNGATSTYSYFKNGSNPLNGQRLQSDGSRTFAYDNNGNTTQINGPDGSTFLTWHAQDRITGISSVISTSFEYDYRGRRTERVAAASTTSFLYNETDRLADRGIASADYLFGPGMDEPLAMLREGTVYYYTVDALGSVAVLSDSAGAVRSDYAYDAWGMLRNAPSGISNPFGYTAREFDEAGLLYYRARFYAPTTGRFISEDPLYLWYDRDQVSTLIIDPLQLSASGNLFLYVGADPISYTDPQGLIFARSCGPSDIANCQQDCQRIGKRFVGCSCFGFPLCAGLLNYSVAKCKDWQRECPPCPPSPGPEINKVPPGRPHFPCKGDHYHYFVYHQGPPPGCLCRLVRRFGGCL